jgi:hypothetical protein
MNRIKNIIWILAVALFFSGCSSSKKSLQRGDYYVAAMEAIKQLRSSPNNKKQQEVLLQAYPLAKENSLRKIRNAMDMNAPDKYGITADEYIALNTLANEIYTCPAALRLIPQPEQFSRQLGDILPLATAEAYQLGEKNLSLKTIQGAREAHHYFVKAKQYTNDYRDVDDKIAIALEMATFKVIVQKPITPLRYQLSSDFFYNNLMAQISKTANTGFVRFFTEEEARNENLTQPDHFLVLDFEDFSVGTMREINNTVEVKRDSVLVGTTLVNGKNQNVYGTVKADLTSSRREVIAEGVLSAKIINASNDRIEQHRNIPGKYTWFNEWATYKGDERALTDAQKRRTNTKPIMPPPQQDLFIEFTKPIFDQTVSFVRNYYNKYK